MYNNTPLKTTQTWNTL